MAYCLVIRDAGRTVVVSTVHKASGTGSFVWSYPHLLVKPHCCGAEVAQAFLCRFSALKCISS